MTITSTLTQTTRPNFLILAPICVAFGVALALSTAGEVSTALSLIAAVGAVLAHAGVNVLNEYFDFESGLDLNTQKTPFSGGSGALPGDPQAARHVLHLGLALVVLTSAIGLYLLYAVGSELLIPGVLGLLLVMLYTPWINRFPWLCLLAPGAGFGFAIAVGSYLVAGGSLHELPWLAIAVPFFLVNNLLLLNQFPDIDADKKAGRATFPIVYGTQTSSRMLGVFYLLAFAGLVLAVIQGSLPNLALLGLLPAPAAVFAVTHAFRLGGDIATQPKALAANVITALASPLLTATGIFIAAL